LADRRWVKPAILFALLAMFTKEIGIVAPLLLFAYDWTYSGFRRAASNAPPYVLLSAVLYIAFRMNALGSAVTAAHPEMSFTAMVPNWPRVLAAYARHLIWPVHLLSLSYDVSGGTFLWPLVLALAVLAVLVWLLRDNDPTIRFGAAWFAITLAPALAIRYITWDDYVHDRYLYLPSVGLALVAAVWLGRIRFTVLRSVAACTLVVLLCWGTRLNLRIWQDGVSLFTRAMETAPRNMMVKNNLAEAYLTAQRPSEAFPLLQQLLRDYPNFDLAIRNMARYYWEIGNVEEADRYREISRQLGKR
jgi:protein O-mannosyl-transferase